MPRQTNLHNDLSEQSKKQQIYNYQLNKKKRASRSKALREKDMEKMLEQVEKHASKGLFDYQIGHLLGMSADNFSHVTKNNEELRTRIEKGRAQAIHDVLNVVYEKAVYERETKACIFFLKTVGGFKENADPLININLNGRQQDQIKEINSSMTDEEATQAYMELCKESQTDQL